VYSGHNSVMIRSLTDNRWPALNLRHVAGGSALLALAAGLAWLPMTWGVLLAAGALAAWLLVRWPWLLWLPLAVLVPVTSGVRVGAGTATELLLAAGVALWFVDGARRRTLRLRWSPIIALAALYAGAQFVSLFFAVDLGEGAAEVIKWVELPVILLVVPAMITSRQGRWLAAALLVGACAQAALGLYQFVLRIGPDDFVILGRFMRASGVFAQPNPFGGFLGLALPVALSLAIWAWSTFLQPGVRRWGDLVWGVFFTAATVLIGAGLLASWSRGAWLGAAAGVLVVLVVRSKQAAIVSALAALLLISLLLLGAFSPALLPQPLVERLADLPAYFGLTDVLAQPVTDENFSVVERIAHWVAAQRMWELSPWFGVGAGNYAAIYPEVRLPRWEDALGHAHNVYLNVLGETGLFGLATYLALWGGVMGWLWQDACRSTSQQRWRAAVAIGVLGMTAHLTVHNLVDNLFVRGMVVYVGLWLALVHINRFEVSS
jgi:putative inorganic carbon (HCO3(-)) transporter